MKSFKFGSVRKQLYLIGIYYIVQRLLVYKSYYFILDFNRKNWVPLTHGGKVKTMKEEKFGVDLVHKNTFYT